MLALLAFEVTIYRHQEYFRLRNKLSPPPFRTIFHEITRQHLDNGIISCAKYFINYSFYKFGVEVRHRYFTSVSATVFMSWEDRALFGSKHSGSMNSVRMNSSVPSDAKMTLYIWALDLQLYVMFCLISCLRYVSFWRWTWLVSAWTSTLCCMPLLWQPWCTGVGERPLLKSGLNIAASWPAWSPFSILSV